MTGAGPSPVNRGRLATELRRAVHGEVRFDEPSRRLYANDASDVAVGHTLNGPYDDIDAESLGG